MSISKFVGLDVHKETIAVALADDGRTGEIRFYGTIPNTRSWTVAPSLKLTLGKTWELRLGSMVGESRAKLLADVSFDGALDFVQKGTYTNRIQALEANAEGPVFRLPGGEARLAAGVGVRKTKFIINVAAIQQGNVAPYYDFSQDRTTSYGSHDRHFGSGAAQNLHQN